jgi:2-iminobutanoate/2-iminopropanoate deaminase
MKHVIEAPDLAPPIAPYSAGVIASNLVFVAQGPIRPGALEVVGTSIEEQAGQTLANIRAVLEKVDLGLRDVVKTTVYLANMDDYDTFNEVYRDYFGDTDLPSRIVVEVSRLPHDLLVEVEVVALAATRQQL